MSPMAKAQIIVVVQGSCPNRAERRFSVQCKRKVRHVATTERDAGYRMCCRAESIDFVISCSFQGLVTQLSTA